MHQVQLSNPLRVRTDDDSLDLKNLTMLHRFALHNNFWDGCYLISKYKDQEHVFIWYKNLYQNASFLSFFRECSEQAEKINIYVEPVWAKKLFDRISTVCYGTKFFYDFLWTMESNEPKLKRIVHNNRRRQFAKRLFRKIFFV